MHIHQIFEAISVIGVLISIGMIYFVQKFAASKNQKNITLICATALAIQCGNYFSLYSVEYQGLLHGLQLKTVGHIFALTAFAVFMVGYCNIKIPSWARSLLFIFNITNACLCLTYTSQKLFFRSIKYVADVKYPYLQVADGVFSILCRYINTLLLAGLCIHIMYVSMKKSKEERRNSNYVIASCVALAAGDIVTTLNIIEGYEFVGIGVIVSLIIIGIAIYKNGILDTMQVAKDKILEEAPDGLLVVDNNREILYFNEKVGIIYPELKGDDVELKKDIINKIFDGTTEMIKTEDSRYEVRVTNLSDKDTTRGYLAWFFDLSYITKYSKELARLSAMVEEANRSKTVFLSNMSHEIRTPMNALVGYAELISEQVKNASVQEYVAEIKQASDNLLAIVDNILDVAKIQSKDVVVIEKRYYMDELIDDCVESISERAKEKQLDIILDIDERLPNELLGDSNHIKRIVKSLLNNSVIYTNEGFIKLIISLENMSGDKATIRFNVADSGIGIKEEDLNKIFDLFEKFDSQSKSGVGGTGFGLAIVKNTADLLNGKVDIKSVVGIGTSISLTLEQRVLSDKVVDVNSITVKSEKGYIEKGKFTAPNARILVTDDNEVNLRVASSLLKSYGIRVDTAISGKDAIKMCRENSYDIVFMDHMMPEMDGIEAMKRIRTLLDDKDYHSIIVALTANAVNGVREMMEKEGFDEYMTKPIEMRNLEKLLRKFLPEDLLIYENDAGAVKIVNDSDISSDAEVTNKVATSNTKKIFEECLAGFDIEQGITNCGGDKETYLEILNIYYESGDKRLEDFESFLSEDDYKNYVIAVHGLKSSSASIGAMKFSERAKQHEFAGKEERFEFIRDDFDSFCDEYREVLAKVRAGLVTEGVIEGDICTCDNEATEGDDHNSQKNIVTTEEISKEISDGISDETSNEICTTIDTLIQEYNFDKALRLIKYLKKYNIKDTARKYLDEVEILLDSGEVDKLFDMTSIGNEPS